jgi:hypothetical protein
VRKSQSFSMPAATASTQPHGTASIASGSAAHEAPASSACQAILPNAVNGPVTSAAEVRHPGDTAVADNRIVFARRVNRSPVDLTTADQLQGRVREPDGLPPPIPRPCQLHPHVRRHPERRVVLREASNRHP